MQISTSVGVVQAMVVSSLSFIEKW